MSAREKSTSRPGRPFEYQKWTMARIAFEIRRIRPTVKPSMATRAAILYWSDVLVAEGDKPIRVDVFKLRVMKALQELQNRKAEVRTITFFDAWHVARGQPSPIKEAADEAIRCFIDQ